MFPTTRSQTRHPQSASLASTSPLFGLRAGENGRTRNKRGQYIRRGIRRRAVSLEQGPGVGPWEFVYRRCEAESDLTGVYQDWLWIAVR
jgi:hypothetical protein